MILDINQILSIFFAIIIITSIAGLLTVLFVPYSKYTFRFALATTMSLISEIYIAAQIAVIYSIYQFEPLYTAGYVVISKTTTVVIALIAIIFVFEMITIQTLLANAGVHASKWVFVTTLMLEMLMFAVLTIPALQPYYCRYQNILTALVIFIGLACIRNKNVFLVGFPAITLIFGVLVMMLAYIQLYIGL